jgi:hypothetical protein
MKKLTLFLASALLMTACATTQNEKKYEGVDKTNFDESIVRNDDFYQWATGGWKAKNPLKPEYSRYGSFDVLRENNEIRINDLFNEMTQTEAEFGSVEQKISDLYKMGLDEERLNAEGAEPIRQALNYILSINNREELIEATDNAASFSKRIIVEHLVEQLKEINCSVLGNYYDCEASVCEAPIRSGEILSYADKYLGGAKSSKGGVKQSEGMRSTLR